jgi:hypothetical protein
VRLLLQAPNQQNKLSLEQLNGQRLDTRTLQAASSADPQLATVGEVAGPKSPEGKAWISRNAYKGGFRLHLQALARALREQKRMLKRLI